jgi:homoserine O-acetyltransferase
MPNPPRILAFSGSARRESLNWKFLAVAVAAVREAGGWRWNASPWRPGPQSNGGKGEGFRLCVRVRPARLPGMKKYLLLLGLAVGSALSAANYPTPVEGDFVLKDFAFQAGGTLPELRIHYRTVGTPQRDGTGVVRNAVLITHGTTGAGTQFIRPEFAGELFGPGQPLDATKYFIVLPDGIGHGKSSKPSDGLHAKFPHYGYRDMVEAQYRLLTEGLGVNHARLVMGTSMGGMHTWLWGELHPEFMDALMPLASLPTQIAGRNRVWRRTVIDAIRNDPEWQGGDYTKQPQSLRTATQMLFFMSSNPVLRQAEAPSLAKTDEVLDAFVANYLKTGDANDVLYAVEASHDYDPNPGLEKIKAPLLAINTADDLINPPELGILEREIKRVAHGRALVIPLSDRTRGHGSHTLAALWKSELARLLAETEH